MTLEPVTLASIAEDDGWRLITLADLLVGVTDFNGANLSITALSIATGQGTLINNRNGTWSYAPALNDDGLVTFSYTVSAGTLTASSTATLDITPVSDAPVTLPVTLAPISEDSGSSLITQADLLVGVTDVDGPNLSITALSIQSGQGAGHKHQRHLELHAGTERRWFSDIPLHSLGRDADGIFDGDA